MSKVSGIVSGYIRAVLLCTVQDLGSMSKVSVIVSGYIRAVLLCRI